jgi:hypothetical protein
LEKDEEQEILERRSTYFNANNESYLMIIFENFLSLLERAGLYQFKHFHDTSFIFLHLHFTQILPLRR